MEDQKTPPVSEVVAKLRESFAPLTQQLAPEMEPADIYSPEKPEAGKLQP